MTKVLYLYGSSAGPNGRKYQALCGRKDFKVYGPELPFPAWKPKGMAENLKWALEAGVSFPKACTFAQAAAYEFEPDVIVGSSMGGSIAIGIRSSAARLLIATATEISVGNSSMPNLVGDSRLPVRSVILHSQADEIVPFSASLRLLEAAASRADPGDAATMVVIQEQLREAGYATQHGRLIPIGRDHRCNDPDPADTWNRDPDPHRAMIRCVEILAGV